MSGAGMTAETSMTDRTASLELQSMRAAAERIRPHVLTTPIHTWRGPEQAARAGDDTEVVLKLELFQRAGSFKARGAVNRVQM